MDNNMFGKTQENDYENNQSAPETQEERQTFGDAADTQAENAQAQTPQYYSGSTPQYSGDTQDAQNPYSYENISSQNPYSYDNQNSQNTYSSYGDQSGQNNQSTYSSAYDNQNSYSYNGTNNQNTYAYPNQNTYGNQDAQNMYSYGYQNNQNTQNNQNPYSYGGQNNQGQTNYNNPYTAPYGQNQTGYQPELEEPVKLGDWLLLQCLLSFVPCVGLILSIVWAFSKTEKQSKVNFCKAYLIVFLAQIAFVFIIFLIYGSVILAAWNAL